MTDSKGKGPRQGRVMLGVSALACMMAATNAQAQDAPVASAAQPEVLGSPAQEQGEPLLLPRGGASRESPGLLDFPDNVAGPDRLSGRRGASGKGGDGIRGVAVLDRRRTAYDPVGIRAGGFEIFPLIGLSANASSNVYRQRDGVSDAFLRANGEILVRSNWQQHSLSLEAQAEQNSYATYAAESTTNYSARLAGQLDVSRGLAFDGAASFQHDHSDRSSTEELAITRSPVRYEEARLEGGMDIGTGRFAARIEGVYVDRDYDDVRALADGALLSQQFRDFHSYGVGARVGYEIAPGRQFYVSANYEDRNFRLLSTPDRNVEIVEVLGGLNSEITPLLRGRLALGYIRANFRGAGLRTRDGLSFDARLTYLFTELTTFSLLARREVGNAFTASSPASFIYNIELRADHELRRNVLLNAGLLYRRADYVSNPLLSQTYGANFGGKWLINQRWRLTAAAGAKRAKSNSVINPRKADIFSASLGVIFQL